MRAACYLLLLIKLLSSCTVGPDYHHPTTPMSAAYKEAQSKPCSHQSNVCFKPAQPRDNHDKGPWWHRFEDDTLNQLETRLLLANQNIKVALANFYQALALVDEARANYYPTIDFFAAASRQKVTTSSANSLTSLTTSQITGNTIMANRSNLKKIYNNYQVGVSASWQLDLWGLVRRTVEANNAYAKASDALLANTTLSSCGALAQYYFELRALDSDQKILNDTVKRYQQLLALTQHQYRSGITAQADILQAQSQVLIAQGQAIQNGINRGIYEHAIAVLVGVAPADFKLSAKPLTKHLPTISLKLPSTLLERRPDVAAAERLVEQANAQIGIAKAAYFPVLSLTGQAERIGINHLAKLFSIPLLGWSIGTQLTQPLFDGGLRNATLSASKANYLSTMANYRQTVLAALQNVEDNLVTLRLLAQESALADRAAVTAKKAAQLVINQYQAGTVNYSNVITAEITAFSAEKNAADIIGLRMTTSVGLIVALGGGW